MPGFPKNIQRPQRDQSKGAAQKVQLQGPERIQELIKQNQQLPAADRAALVESTKAKGNEFFRSGQTADAVECYTLCIGLDPTQLAAFTNRAQAYLRLQKWDDAISDCNSTLSQLQQQEAAGGTPELSKLRVKALVRRGKALQGKNQLQGALQDFEAALLLVPDNEELLGLAAQARKSPAQQAAATQPAAGPKPSGRRIPVVEVSQEEGEEEGGSASSTPIVAGGSPADKLDKQQSSQQQSPQQQQQQLASSPSSLSPPSAGKQSGGRIRITVVEEEEDSDDASPTDGDTEQRQQSPSGQQQQLQQQQSQPEHQIVERRGSDIKSSSSGTGDSSSGDEASDGSVSGEDGLGGVDGAAAEVVEPVEPEYEEALEEFCKLGKAAFEQGDYMQALNIYNKALQHAPDSTRVLVNASLTLLKLAKPVDAHEKATLAIGLQPRNAKAYHARHKAKEALGDYKGAITDLHTVITLEPPARQLTYTEELAALENRAQVATLQTQWAAEQKRQGSRKSYNAGSFTIEEVVEEPEEAQQKLHDELKAHERTWLRRAGKLHDRAGIARADYNAQRAAKLEEAQQRQQRALRMQQQRRQARTHKQSLAGQGIEARQQQAASRAAPRSAPLAVTLPAGAAPAPAEPAAEAGNGAVPAGLSALPLQHDEHAQAAADGRRSADECASSSTAAAEVAATAASAVAPVEVATGPSTPRDGPESAPTPTSTPAGPMFVFGSPGSSTSGLPKKWQQQRSKGASPTGLQRQQQQQVLQQPQALTPAAVEANIAKQVDDLREQGNRLMSGGDLAGAEEAYKQALDMDGDNIKVLLNLAQLALLKKDADTALRCCDEVLGQQGASGLTAALVQKATLRRGLALELLGQYEEALQLLSIVKEQAGADAPSQLAADMLRLAQLVQQQKQAEAAAALHPPTPASSAPPSAATAAEGQATAGLESSSVVHDGSSSSSSDDVETVTDKDALQQKQLQRGPGSSHADAGTLSGHRSQPFEAAGSGADLNAGQRGLPVLQALSQGQQPAAGAGSHVSSTDAEPVESLPAIGQEFDPLKEDDKRSALNSTSISDLLHTSTLLQQLQHISPQQKQQAAPRKPPQQQQREQQQQRSVKQQPPKQQKQQDNPSASTAALLQRIQEAIAQRQKRDQQQQLEASPEREKGNAAWNAGNVQAALKHYTAALTADPADVRAYSNRAQVYLKLKRPAKVEEDCSMALGLLQQPGGVGAAAVCGDLDAKAAEALHSKVLYCRAVARREQGKVKEAFADVKALRELPAPCEPAVERLYTELAEAYKQQLMRLVQARSQQAVPDAEETTEPAAAAAGTAVDDGAAAAASSTPAVRLHRIHIEETDGSESDDEAVSAAAHGVDVGSSEDESELVIAVQPAAAVK